MNRPRERVPEARGVTRPTLDLVVSKLRPPRVRSTTVERSSLLERLCREASPQIVSVVAPAGYGKTTLLRQWDARSPRRFAWLSLNAGDNTPSVLLGYVAEALNAIEPIGERVFDTFVSSGDAIREAVAPRLAAALAAMTAPLVLVFDDVHLLRESECWAALSLLADSVPPGSGLAFAGRDPGALPIARLRAEGRLLDIGPDDLALTVGEAERVLRDAGVGLDADQVTAVHRRTEGWPVGVYLAGLAVGPSGPAGNAAAFDGGDLFVSEYVESEFLSGLSRRRRQFLTRTAVLDRMSDPLCEAVVGLPGAPGLFAEFVNSGVPLVPLDHRGLWYRHHRLFRDVLLTELQRREPELIPVLQRRAAAWCLANDQAEAALEYSMAAGDVQASARLIESLWHTAYAQGRTAVRRRWIGWLADRGAIHEHPILAVYAALLGAQLGHANEAERWSDLVEHQQDPGQPHLDDPDAEVWASALRALLCRRGVEQMRVDADDFAQRITSDFRLAAQAPYASLQALLLQGTAHVLGGDVAAGAELLEQAAGTDDVGAPDLRARALIQLALLAMARDDWRRAEACAGQAQVILGPVESDGSDECYLTPLVCAAQARLAAHRVDVPAAWQHLTDAQRALPLLTYALPDLAVQTRIELTRVRLALGDVTGARALLREIDDVLNRRPGLGTLVADVDQLRTQLAERRSSDALGASSLTAAELRLLPYLRTHLTSERIAERLSVSSWTVKTQVKSIYRKLGVSSRDGAVQKADAIGLLGI